MPEPSIPEETPDFEQHHANVSVTVNKTQNISPDTAFRLRKTVYTDFPSIKYAEIDEPVAKSMLRTAQLPPNPTLPRRPTTRTWNATTKERNPLASCLTGPGRAGKYGELITEKGARYEGEVLAGRPHGVGKYFVRKDGNRQGDWVLQYEGSWVQGIREGPGYRVYPNGESYDGDFTVGVRHGYGRYTFTSGDVYAGEWVDDRRTGHGTYFYANGDVFVGNFIKDRKEGRGTLFMMGRQRKYIAEYVSNQPKCGSVLNIEDGDLEPLHGQLHTMSLTSKLDLAATGALPLPIPNCELLQPNKVLAAEVVAVRKTRAEGGRAMRMVQAHSGTLSSKEIEMLRHSFTLMAAGDGAKAGLLPHQLRELIVMAGLDPAAPATRQLVDSLLEQRGKGMEQARISFDNFMKVAIYFQEESTQVHMAGEEQQQQQWEQDEEEVEAEFQQEAAAQMGEEASHQEAGDGPYVAPEEGWGPEEGAEAAGEWQQEDAVEGSYASPDEGHPEVADR